MLKCQEVSLNTGGLELVWHLHILKHWKKSKKSEGKLQPCFVHVIFPVGLKHRGEMNDGRVLVLCTPILGPLKPSAFDKSCHHVTMTTTTRVSLLQDYFWHPKRIGCRVSGRQPHEWLMSVLRDFAAFPCSVSDLRVSSAAVKEITRSRESVHFQQLLKKQGSGVVDVFWWRRVKASRRSPSHTVLENTHSRRECAEAL